MLLSEHLGVRPPSAGSSPQVGRRTHREQPWAARSVGGRDSNDVSLEASSASADSLSSHHTASRDRNSWEGPLSADGFPQGDESASTAGSSVSRASRTSAREAELQAMLAARDNQLSAMRAEVDAIKHQQGHTPVSPLEQLQQQHSLQLQQLQQQLSTLSARPPASTSNDSFTHLGAEDWIIDAKIEAAFTDTHLWWHVAAGRWEDEWETMLRARVYAYLKTKVPADMYKDGEENDIRFIYAHVVNLNMDGSDEQIVDMQKKVLTFNKKSRPMKI